MASIYHPNPAQELTYASHPSHQIFLREYAPDTMGIPAATGRLVDGIIGGYGGTGNVLCNWDQVKAQAASLLGIQLTDADIFNVPLLRTDAQGKFIPGPHGFPQLVMGLGPDRVANTADDLVVEGNPFANGGAGVSITTVLRTGQAFLSEITHTAVAAPVDSSNHRLLDRYLLCQAGHNRKVAEIQDALIADALASGSNSLLNRWLTTEVIGAADLSSQDVIAALAWNGERLFQAARFAAGMDVSATALVHHPLA
jgi:hypothetical protein